MIKTKLELIFILFTCLLCGFILGVTVMNYSCQDTIEFLGETYFDIVAKVVNLDLNRMMYSYEYCDWLVNNITIQEYMEEMQKEEGVRE